MTSRLRVDLDKLEPEERRFASELYARVYGAAYAAALPVKRDSAGNAVSSPADEAELMACDAVHRWAQQFHPNAFKAPATYGQYKK